MWLALGLLSSALLLRDVTDLREWRVLALRVLMGLFCAWGVVRSLLTGVVANARGIAIRGFYRTLRIPWHEIDDVHVHVEAWGAHVVLIRNRGGEPETVPLELRGSKDSPERAAVELSALMERWRTDAQGRR